MSNNPDKNHDDIEKRHKDIAAQRDIPRRPSSAPVIDTDPLPIPCPHESIDEYGVMNVQIDKISTKYSPRKRRIEEDIGELMESLRTSGLMHPIVVSRTSIHSEDFVLLAGKRRLEAAKGIGWNQIVSIVIPKRFEEDIVRGSIIENLQRRDLPCKDMIEACNLLYKNYRSISDSAQKLGVYQNKIEHYLLNVAMPNTLKKLIEKGKMNINEGNAFTLALYPNIMENDKQKIEKLIKYVETLSNKDRQNFFEVIEDYPGLSFEELVNLSSKPNKRQKITINIPQKYEDALTQATEELELNPDKTIERAFIEWLTSKGYLT